MPWRASLISESATRTKGSSDTAALAAFLVGYILLLHLFGTAAEDKALLQKFTSLVSPRRKESL